MTLTNGISQLFAKKSDEALNSIPTKGIGVIKDEVYQSQFPWRNCYSSLRGSLNGEEKPAIWTKLDSFINSKLGFKVQYKNTVDNSRNKILEKKLNRYSAPLANQQIKLHKANFSEADIMKGVKRIDESCDLIGTTLKEINSLESIGGNLTLDCASSLKKISNLSKIGGKLYAVAKNKEQMDSFLKSIGLMSKEGTLIPEVAKGVELIMKTYL